MKESLEWLLQRWPDQNDILRSYPLNLVMFIAQMCDEYSTHKLCDEYAKDKI